MLREQPVRAEPDRAQARRGGAVLLRAFRRWQGAVSAKFSAVRVRTGSNDPRKLMEGSRSLPVDADNGLEQR
ncbi:hypothetical protein DUI87_11453 [Hirundo rustica rustica]|uniref:Uncharacterized protein n=1 Tax=Hirundo rustica rustica TaxID=333673 RepID=A0A3M0KJF7_HIRRU|nr:hypothetical protein DUI87_11453 [Hirundo rustica rustica]